MQLETERLRLREFEESDAGATNIYERDPSVVQYQSFAPRTLEESLEYIKSSMATAREEPRVTFDLAVVLRAEDTLVGRCGLRITQPEIREGALWYILNPTYWGRGIIPEAAQALVAFGFDELKLHRLIVDCDPANNMSIRVAEKLGMRREALFLENSWVKGGWVDSPSLPYWIESGRRGSSMMNGGS